MEYKEYKPTAFYQAFIDSFWVFKVYATGNLTFPIQHESLPDSCLSIVTIHQPYYTGVRMLGPYSQKFEREIYANSIYIGVRFHPWIDFGPVIPSKKELVNQTAAAPPAVEQIFNPLVGDASNLNYSIDRLERITRRFLNFSAISTTQNELVRFICMELNSQKPIGEIVALLPASSREILRKFKEETG